MTQATERAATAVPFDGVDALGTAPLVVVAGHQYTGAVDDSGAFLSFVLQAYSEVAAASNPPTDSPTETPAPSPSATPVPSPAAT